MRGASPTSVLISCGVIARQALGVALLKAFQRARTLYLLTVTLTLMFAALSVQLGLGVFVAGAIAFYRATQPPASLESVLVFNQVFAKVNLSISRLIVFTGFLTFAFSLLTVAWAPIDRALRWLLLPLSQHALSAYTLHLFVTALIMRMKPAIVGTAPATAAQNTLLQVVAIALMWAIIMLKPTALRQFHASVSRVKNLRGITREHLSLPAHSRDR